MLKLMLLVIMIQALMFFSTGCEKKASPGGDDMGSDAEVNVKADAATDTNLPDMKAPDMKAPDMKAPDAEATPQ